jgi:hypothetical protein
VEVVVQDGAVVQAGTLAFGRYASVATVARL